MFTPAANVNNNTAPVGPGTITVSLFDGSLTGSDNSTITINAVNDAPVITVPPTVNLTESGNPQNVSLGSTVFADDASETPGANVSVTMSVTQGTLTLRTDVVGGLVAGQITNNGTGSLTLSGTISQIDTTLAQVDGLKYTSPAPHFNGNVPLAISINDNGFTGSGGPQSANTTVTLNVGAANDPPIVVVPGPQSIAQNFQTPITGISVSDVDVGSGIMTATLSASNGVITLTQISGLTFHSGFGNGTATVVFDGTITDVNNALASVNYTSNVAFSGTDILTVTVNDNGNTGSGGPQQDSKTISISVGPVNHAPVNTVPGQQTVNEDTTLTFSSPVNPISIADPENTGSNIYQVTLSVAHGTLTLSSTAGLTFLSGDGVQDASFTAQGTIASINAALNGLQYVPSLNYNSLPPNTPDALVITTNDLGNSGPGGPLTDTSSVSIVVNPVNDAPTINFNGTTVTSVTLPVVPPPPATVTPILEGTTVTFNAANSNLISTADVDNPTGLMIARITVTGGTAVGTITLGSTTGLDFGNGVANDDGVTDADMEFTGTLANIQAALNGLKFIPATDFSGTASFKIIVNDNGQTGLDPSNAPLGIVTPAGGGSGLSPTAANSEEGSATINLVYTDVNDAPKVNFQSSIAFVQSGTGQSFSNATFFSGISVGSSFEAAAGQTLTVASITVLSDPSGIFTGTGGATPTSNIGTLVGTSPTNANASLNFGIGANKNGTATIAVTLTDSGDTSNGGVNTTTQFLTISVAPVNQPPVFTSFPSATNETQTVTITGAPTGGTFTLSFTGAAATPVAQQTTTPLAFNAAALDVQTALATLPGIGAGNVAVTGSAGGPYSVTFLGGLGSRDINQLTATSSLTGGTTPGVGVTTPTQGITTVNEDTTLVFDGASGGGLTHTGKIQINDPDAGNGNETLTLSVSNGVLNVRTGDC